MWEWLKGLPGRWRDWLEPIARFGAGAIGAFYVLAGLSATFETQNGSAGATLVTIGTGLIGGAVIWPLIEELDIGGIRFKRLKEKLAEAKALEEAGEREIAESIRESVLEEVTPVSADYVTWRSTLDQMVVDGIKEEGYPIRYRRSVGSAPRSLSPDMVVELRNGLLVGFETFVTSTTATARQGLQRRLETAGGSEYAGYFLTAGSPDRSVAEYMDSAVQKRVREWLDRSTPHVALDFKIVTSLEQFDDVAEAIGGFLRKMEASNQGQ